MIAENFPQILGKFETKRFCCRFVSYRDDSRYHPITIYLFVYMTFFANQGDPVPAAWPLMAGVRE
ncbi:hypothetical protein EN794_038645 [Mesorhizobium sp. M00.F.Ca.ET.151.01.1.1]|uniref:hypothetical protein n=1 Tax=unclassified Mesorhizobium TaxID=325217 RepID=UPI000FCB5960|nr:MULTISPECIES: hypothetical protein [unclassified Mesorhizobium]RVD54069.1 hypothetical protein EN746_07415 [Mesorhizobium sp. M8A.F.Ca.ET.023.02.2.1]RWC77589.1 MAG: hypothetical protein EOS30_08430 [Mesorhizobium sp.]TGR33596.1 hypothetical protein EN840_04540 [Mesorhizobium sp. M8A.F.Ca.ET.197.01.1.1]TGR58843.1 hypothetical protein EN842_04530 [bacterium M00.F.Ca.ET.199.01.1.1]TGU92044.1 hypothetical protein EN794_038645 [Mesorhizobium sp. M00.F.Ca.ET.151.01.1.1]TGV53539.1 hypothetical pr